MILSDRDIVKARKRGDIIIRPFERKSVQPASVDVHLDRQFLVFDTTHNFVIDPKSPQQDLMKPIEIGTNEPFILHPGEFALGLIYEETGVSDRYACRLEGKSSLGRLGLIIHTTAGFLDPGNSLHMTLELFNAGRLPIKLYYRMPIGQVAFEELSSPCERPYGSEGLNSKYFGDTKPVASKMYLNFGKKVVRRKVS
jgi:dCTP deaminase